VLHCGATSYDWAVQHQTQRENHMPIKKILMLRRKQGLTPDQFRDGYENSHSRIAVELFGHLWIGYRRNYLTRGYPFTVKDGTLSGPEDVGFDAISEFILRDEAAYEEMGRIATANWERIKEDEARWFDQVHSYVMSCETIEENLRKC